jgi:adenylate cyclase
MAAALNPDDPQANSVLGVALALSATRYDEGVSWIEKAVKMNPLDPINHLYLSQLALAHLCAERYDKAVETAQEAIRRKHGFIESHIALASALGHLQRPDDARDAIEGFQDAAVFVDNHLVFAPEVKQHVLDGLRLAGLVK